MKHVATSEELKPATYHITHLNVMVPYRKPGNVVEHVPVTFSVHQHGNQYKAIPLCDAAIKRLTGLPEMIWFEIKNGRPVLLMSGWVEAVNDIIG